LRRRAAYLPDFSFSLEAPVIWHRFLLVALLLPPALAQSPAYARLARVQQWEGTLHMVYDFNDPHGTRTTHAVSDWSVVMTPIDAMNDPTEFAGTWKGHGSATAHSEGNAGGAGHRHIVNQTASGSTEVSVGLNIRPDGYEFHGLGYLDLPGTQSMSCSKGTCKADPDVTVTISNSDSWVIRRALPAQGFVLSGSAVLSHGNTPNEVAEGNTYSIQWEFRPVGTRLGVEITKLEQDGGPRTANPSQVVFQNGTLRVVAEAKVTPASSAAQLRWQAPAIGAAQPTVKSTIQPGGIVRATITWQGLPAANSDFGNKQLKATVDDRTADRAFQVFFERDAKDNPKKTEPNWYVYWKQGPVPELERFTYSADSSMAAGYDPVRKTLTITAEGPGVIPGLNVQLITNDKAHSYRLIRERCEGIRAVAAIVRHELRHKELHEMAGADYDQDAVIDNVETASASPWLDPFQPNSYANFDVNLFYKDLENWKKEGDEKQQAARADQVKTHAGQLRVKGDNELLAIIAEGKKKANESQDWAFPGAQTPKP
jgi:hypothetical protein